LRFTHEPPTQNRPRKGGASSRAINAWKSAFASHKPFIHSGPDSLPSTNLPINPDRNPFSLASSLRRKPALGLNDVIEDYAIDTQQSFPALRNYSSTVYAISNEQVSKDTVALIEHL
jgi:hypothetical protein